MVVASFWSPSVLSAWSRAAATIVMAICGAVLVGWIFDIGFLKSVLPGFVTMKANTAIAFVVASASLRAATRDDWRETETRVYAALVALIGLLTLSEYIFGWNLRIDQLLFRDPATPEGELYIPRTDGSRERSPVRADQRCAFFARQPARIVAVAISVDRRFGRVAVSASRLPLRHRIHVQNGAVLVGRPANRRVLCAGRRGTDARADRSAG